MSSNFFTQQDLARRNTRILVVLFTIAVLLLIVLSNILVLVTLGFVNPNEISQFSTSHSLPWPIIGLISLSVIVAVCIAIAVKWLQLQGGGKVVAESLGGSRISPDSQDPSHRRLLNIVEEMALAANTPVPPVYLLPERAINAFAAGYSPGDAVIGVTQGCVDLLSRDELQGVIAHEFSHILNGDMRMNIRLIAILNGILFIGLMGEFIMRSSSSSRSRSRGDKNGGGIILLGLGLMIIGYLGSFFGNLIKAALSRQREFLADASAVQFTRNPKGIAGALKAIGAYQVGSKIQSSNAAENSHLFFGEAISRFSAIFATHPPLETRIKRLDPSWNGKFHAPAEREKTTNDDNQAPSKADASEKLKQILPLLLLNSSRQTGSAIAIVCCLLLQDKQDILTKQLQLIKSMGGQDLLNQVDALCDSIARLNPLQQVQLLQLVIPALKTLTHARFLQFETLLKALKQASNEPTIIGWLVSTYIDHTVATEFDKTLISKHYQKGALSEHSDAISALLALVSSSAGNKEQQQLAWQEAIKVLPFELSPTLPEINFTLLDETILTLLALNPQHKQILWQAIEAGVKADNLMQTQEHAFLLSLALLLEMPFQREA